MNSFRQMLLGVRVSTFGNKFILETIFDRWFPQYAHPDNAINDGFSNYLANRHLSWIRRLLNGQTDFLANTNECRALLLFVTKRASSTSPNPCFGNTSYKYSTG